MGHPTAILKNRVLGRGKRCRRDDGLFFLLPAEPILDKVRNPFESVGRKQDQLAVQLYFERALRIYLLRLFEA